MTNRLDLLLTAPAAVLLTAVASFSTKIFITFMNWFPKIIDNLRKT